MIDIGKLADDGVAALGKLESIATKIETDIQSGGPEAVKILEEVKTVLGEIGPVFKEVMPVFTMIAGFFPHANPAPSMPTH
jgi:hypothetical protein